VTAAGCPSGGTQVGAAKTLSNGQAASDATTNTNANGKYCWRAEYSGDSVYPPLSHTDVTLECFTVFCTSPGTVPLAAAILPGSSSVEIKSSTVPIEFQTASAYAVVINGGSSIACNVRIQLANTPICASTSAPAQLPITLNYAQTDPNTNQIPPHTIPNQPVNIPGGGQQTFVIGLSSANVVDPTDIAFKFSGDNTATDPPAISGLNTLLTSFSSGPVPNIVAIVSTDPPGGIVHVPGQEGTGAFAVAVVNAGQGRSPITVSADSGNLGPASCTGVVLPVDISICRTDPSSACTAPPTVVYSNGVLSPGLRLESLDPGASATFSIFVKANGTVCFNPAFNRVFVRFSDSQNIRGLASVAVTTTEPDEPSQSCGGP
jgi:hypothetical protein